MCEWGPTGAAPGFGSGCFVGWVPEPLAARGASAVPVTVTAAEPPVLVPGWAMGLWAGSVCAARSPRLLTAPISFEKPLAPGLLLRLPSHPAHPAPGHSLPIPSSGCQALGMPLLFLPAQESPGVTLGAAVTEKARTSAFLDNSTEGRKGVD